MSLIGDIFTGAIDIAAFPLKNRGRNNGLTVGTDGDGLKEAMPVPSDITDKLREIIEKADQ